MRDGLGWLGWLPADLLAADVNAIEIALEARVEMLEAVFYGKKPKAQPVSKDSSEYNDRLERFFDSHNARFEAKERQAKARATATASRDAQRAAVIAKQKRKKT